MTTGRSEQVPVRLGCLLGISRGGATGFSANEWLGNPCEDLGRQIHDPFLLVISRGEFREPNCFREGQLVKNNMPAHPFKDSKARQPGGDWPVFQQIS